MFTSYKKEYLSTKDIKNTKYTKDETEKGKTQKGKKVKKSKVQNLLQLQFKRIKITSS